MSEKTDAMMRLMHRAKALVDAVSFDNSGAMIAGQWQGGNGGLISRETIKVADELRREIEALEAQARANE